MRFYHLDPERVLAIPQYLLSELVFYLPPIEANEMQNAITASSAPHLRTEDYRSLLHRLGALAEALAPAEPEPEPMTLVEHDPEKAAAWFAAQGVHVG